MYSRDMRIYFVIAQNLIFFSHNLYVKSQQKFVTGKCIPGKHSKIKKNTKCHKNCYKSSELQSNTYSEIKLYVKEIVIKPTSINPLKNSGT